MTNDKPKFIDILVDLESLGVGNDAPVIQVSAGVFHIGDHKVFDTFNQKVDLNTFDKLHIDPETLHFWTNTNEQLKQLQTFLLPSGITESDMWTEFSAFLDKYKDYEIRLWGNGIAFDNVKTAYNFKRFNLPYPVAYYNERDVRTITQLAADKVGCTPQQWQAGVENDNAHDALSDVKWEIEYVNRAYNLVVKRTVA